MFKKQSCMAAMALVALCVAGPGQAGIYQAADNFTIIEDEVLQDLSSNPITVQGYNDPATPSVPSNYSLYLTLQQDFRGKLVGTATITDNSTSEPVIFSPLTGTLKTNKKYGTSFVVKGSKAGPRIRGQKTPKFVATGFVTDFTSFQSTQNGSTTETADKDLISTATYHISAATEFASKDYMFFEDVPVAGHFHVGFRPATASEARGLRKVPNTEPYFVESPWGYTIANGWFSTLRREDTVRLSLKAKKFNLLAYDYDSRLYDAFIPEYISVKTAIGRAEGTR